MKHHLGDFPETWDGETVEELGKNCRGIPQTPGIYCVLYDSPSFPSFVDNGTGGRFKERDPNVAKEKLVERWVPYAKIIYIGQTSTSLKERICKYVRFGQGHAVAHWGGRYIWQIHDSKAIIICWRPTVKGEDPIKVEAEMIQRFKKIYGRVPFANLGEGNGKIKNGKDKVLEPPAITSTAS